MLKISPKSGISLLSCLLLFAASCGATQTDEASTTVEDDQTTIKSTTVSDKEEPAETSVKATDQPASSATKVELVDQGASPRVQLRLQLEEGEQKATITQDQTISQSGIVGLPTDPIALAYATEMTVSITKDGDNFTAVSEIADIVEVDETDTFTAQIIPTLKAQMIGVKTTLTLDPTGQLVGTPELSGIDDVNPQVAQAMEQINDAGLAAPLPTEEVGVGATWKVIQNLELSGVEIEQEVTYEITSIDGNVISMKTSTTQAVEEGSAIKEQGQELPVKLWESNATGDMQLDLTKVFPQSTGESKAKQVLETPSGDLTQEIDLSISIEPS